VLLNLCRIQEAYAAIDFLLLVFRYDTWQNSLERLINNLQLHKSIHNRTLQCPKKTYQTHFNKDPGKQGVSGINHGTLLSYSTVQNGHFLEKNRVHNTHPTQAILIQKHRPQTRSEFGFSGKQQSVRNAGRRQECNGEACSVESLATSGQAIGHPPSCLKSTVATQQPAVTITN
jgi:hypothetical protein